MGADAIEQSAETGGGWSSSGRSTPSLELIRDGRVICGYPCRFTAARLLLLTAANIAGFNDSDEDPTEDDALNVMFFLAECNTQIAVEIADKPEAMAGVLKKWRRKFRGLIGGQCAAEVMEWLGELSESMPDENEEGGGVRDQTWFLSMVDTLAHEYSWSRDYILWFLPMNIATRLTECIAIRRGMIERVNDISDDAVAMLEHAERERDKPDG